MPALFSRLGVSRDTHFFERRGPLAARAIISTRGEPLLLSEQQFVIERPRGHVFDAYRRAPLWDVWPADRIVFRGFYLPGSLEKKTGDWPREGLHEGMKLFADLIVRPFHPLRIMVGVEVTRVESDNEIRYDYLDGSVTMGYNSVRFLDDGARTRIHHASEYRGTSALFRATFPIFQKSLHVGFVNAMHASMKARIENR